MSTTDRIAELNEWWNDPRTTAEERGKFLQQLADEMGMDAFYEMLVEAFGEDELRAELARRNAH